ncbi:MAG: hypothetical protein JW727_02315 [Candidatus Aenigmarchaeota archaeon]|nr:hypothetical protein [Candidatus Aenigmarchaeota archaeon]
MKDDITSKYEHKADDLFGTLEILRIILDLDKFQAWFSKSYQKDTSVLLEGYKLFLETALRTFFYEIDSDWSLGLKEDAIFYRAGHRGINLDKIPNTCEKVILIKNLDSMRRDIRNSRNFDELYPLTQKVRTELLARFVPIYDMFVEDNLGFGKDNALRYAAMFQALIFFSDTSKKIPKGYYLFSQVESLTRKQYNASFEGYKYTLQFLWESLLEKESKPEFISEMITAKDWSIDLDVDFEKLDESLEALKESPGEREDLDSYFGRINEGLIKPLEKRLKFKFISQTLLSIKTKPPKEIFGSLLNVPKMVELSEQEKLNCFLLWYPIDYRDSSKGGVFNGSLMLMSLIAGFSEIKVMDNVDSKVQVCKFIHPVGWAKDKNDYSYGILIESYGTFGSDFSGWIMFYDCCGDYSGFSGTEHMQIEAIIDSYKKQGLVELRQMTIGKSRLRKYIAKSVVGEISTKIENELEKTSTKNKELSIVKDARGLVNELFSYYILSKRDGYDVDWNVHASGKQIDIRLENDAEVLLIECKVDPNNLDLGDELQHLKERLSRTDTEKKKRGIFWFWAKPSDITIDRIEKEGFTCEIIKNLIQKDRHISKKKLDTLRYVLNYKGTADREDSFDSDMGIPRSM